MRRLWWVGLGIVILIAAGAAAYYVYQYFQPAPQVTIEEVVKGDGAFVFSTQGDEIVMTANYTGQTQDGTVFDDVHAQGKAPYQFTFNSVDLPPGWATGINGMQIGGTRIITVPAALVPKTASANIPPNTTLIYTVTLSNAFSNDTGLLPPSVTPSSTSTPQPLPQTQTQTQTQTQGTMPPPASEQGLLPPTP